MKFSFIQLLRLHVYNTRVFQHVPINLNMTVGQQAACLLLYRYTQSSLTVSYIC